MIKCGANNNVIEFYDIKKTTNNVYLIMEYCQDGDLSTYLRNNEVSESDVIDILLQIINGFKCLHQNNVIHRDFKLENVLINNGVVKIADFGFAKILDDDQQAETVLGSPLNMAPEIISGQLYDSKVDVWALGCCLYQMLFKKPAFDAANFVELHELIMKSRLKFPEK